MDEFRKKELIIRVSRVETLLAKQEAKLPLTRYPGPKSRRNEPNSEDNEDNELLRLLEDPVRRSVLKADLDRSKSKRTLSKKPTRQATINKSKLNFGSIFSDSDEGSQRQTVEISDNDNDEVRCVFSYSA